MTPAVIASIAAGAAVVISAVFTGLVQLQHNRSQHGQDPAGQAAGSGSQQQPPARS